MKKTWNLLFGSLLFFSFLASLGGCGKGYDESEPSLTGVDVSENDIIPTVAGSVFTFEMSFSDNQELNQAIVRIEPSDDVDGFFEWTEGDWNTFELYDLEGTNVSQLFVVNVPTTARGRHAISIDVIDDAGNEAESFVFFIDVQNGLLPFIEVLTINGQSTLPIDVVAGEALQITGSITGGGIFSNYSVMVNDSLILNTNPSSSFIGLDFYPLTVPAGMIGSGILTISALSGEELSTRTFPMLIN